MSSADKINPFIRRFLSGGSSGFVRVPPEPTSRLGFDFRSILSNVSSIASGAIGAPVGGIQPQYLDLINKQIEMQEQMQLVSLTSNIEKDSNIGLIYID